MKIPNTNIEVSFDCVVINGAMYSLTVDSSCGDEDVFTQVSCKRNYTRAQMVKKIKRLIQFNNCKVFVCSNTINIKTAKFMRDKMVRVSKPWELHISC